MTSDISATQYLKIDSRYAGAARLIGDYNGEFVLYELQTLGHKTVYTAHLAPGFRMPEGGVAHRWAREGMGAVVVEGISREGWRAICDAVGGADTHGQVLDALVNLQYITWDVPHHDIGRLNEMARADHRLHGF